MIIKRGEVDERWRQRAACRGMDTELFFPNVGYSSATAQVRAQIRHVRAVCRTCPVRIECYAYAKYFNTRHGIWGGVLLTRRGKARRNKLAV